MRVLTLALMLSAGLPGMIAAQQPVKIAAPKQRIDENNPWKGKLIFPKGAGIGITKGSAKDAASIGTLDEGVAGYLVLDQVDNKVQVQTWYEAKVWLNIADLGIAEEELSQDPLRYFTAKIRANPNEPAFYKYRGIAWRDLKKEIDVAILDFSESLRLNGDQADVYTHRGIAHHNKGEYDQAATNFDRATRLDPKSAWAYCMRAHALRAKWMAKGGVEDLVTAWKEAQKQDDMEKNLAATRNLDAPKRELEEALRDYNETLRYEPNAEEMVGRYRIWVSEQLNKIRDRNKTAEPEKAK